MTQILDGELQYSDLTKNSKGGTELMAQRLLNNVDPELLKGKQIIFSRVGELEPNFKKILYVHDLATDPEVAKLTDPVYRNQFEKIVFVSHWQQHTYNMVLGVPFSQSIVIQNAIEPLHVEETEPLANRPLRLIYHTTPHRGLELLVPAFKYLKENKYDIELDVYSSFKAYGWEERDRPYEQLFEEMSQIEGIRNHGFVPNEEIRRVLAKADIFAYPNIWPETSCLALIEALCAGNMCLHSNLGALPETACGLSSVYMYNEDKSEHANTFTRSLAGIYHFLKLFDHGELQALKQQQSFIANGIYSIQRYKTAWEGLLRNI